MSSSTWNQETKTKLNEKVTANYNDLGSLVRHVIRASKSNDVSVIKLTFVRCFNARHISLSKIYNIEHSLQTSTLSAHVYALNGKWVFSSADGMIIV